MKDSSKPKVIFVLGGPGSGKGTQCALMIQKYQYAKFEHISTGSLLRKACESNSAEHQEVRKLMKEGKMVPSAPLVKLVKEHIVKMGSEHTYILDGFPRNKQNLEAWNEIIGDQFEICFLLYFEVSENEMRNRLTKRALTSGRADDNAETIEKRLKTFYSETKPMLDYYKGRGGKTVIVDGNQSIEAIEYGVCVELKKNNLI